MPRALSGFVFATVSALSACTGHVSERGVRDASTSGPDAGRRADAGATTTTGPIQVTRDASQPMTTRPDAQIPREAGLPRDASSSDAGSPTMDRFGVRMLNPTTRGGREWFLPDDAVTPTAEWNVESNRVSRTSEGVFHTVGNNGEVRLSVASPHGLAWWRNVEMTGYFRYTDPMDSNGQERHWELLARGERHSDGSTSAVNINAGVAAPTGTSVWPGYPFTSKSVIAPCLGTSYHGNFYLTGQGLFEKEISHIAGYANQRAKVTAAGFADPLQRWFGLKFVVRNADADARVHLELWLDANADGDWKRLTQTDDMADGWQASDPDLDGCTAAPFSYQRAQLLTWAGPWVIFRSDSVAMDFRWLSAREIDPL